MTATNSAEQGRTSSWAEEDRKATEVPDGPKWRPSAPADPDEDRGRCCFSGEETGAGGETDKPLMNEKKPTL